MSLHSGGRGRGHAGRNQVTFSPLTLFAGTAGVWYDPADPTKMSQTSGGTLGDVVIGQPVGKIADLSGGTADAVQATAGARPTLRQNAAGKYYLEFDGVDDFLGFTSPAGVTQSTLVLAGKLRTAPGAAYKNGFSIANQTIYANLGGGTWGGFNGVDVPSGTASTTTLVMTERTRAFNDVDLFSNSTKVVSTVGTGFNARVGLIGAAGAGSQHADFDMYGAFAINRLLTDAEVTALTTWMQTRAGI